MYFVCPGISRPYHRAWHIVAYSVNFCWMNESQQICNFSTNNTSLVTKQPLPVLFFVFYPNAFLVWSSQPACEVISYLYLTERDFLIHSFIQQAPAMYQALCWALGIQSWIRHGPCPQGMLGLMEEMDQKAAVSVQLVSAVRDVCTGPGEPSRGTSQPQSCNYQNQRLPSCKLLFFPCILCSASL